MTISEQYFEYIDEEEFRIQRCQECNSWIYYPRAWCTECHSTELTWEQAAGTGTVLTYSVVHVTPIEAYKDRTPYVIAVVRLAEGPQMLANVINCEPNAVDVGSRVQVIFETRTRGGTDESKENTEHRLPQFELVAE